MLKADGAREMARTVPESARALEFRSHVPSLKLGMVCEALRKLCCGICGRGGMITGHAEQV